MDTTIPVLGVVAVIALAMGFNYTNGFHDAANAIATSVSTRALTPRVALAMAAVANLFGAFFGTKVAQTIGSGIIEQPQGVNGLWLVAAALVGAIGWNLLTWWFGLPSSSSHALIGGLAGAALVAGVAVQWGVIWEKVVIPMIVSPVVGLVGGYLVMTAIFWLFRRANPGRVTRGFRLAQTASAAAMAFGHGLQDAGKTAGVVLLALNISGLHNSNTVPIWVLLLSAVVISAGTYAGGWRIMRTLGSPDHPPHAAAGLRSRDDGRVDPLRGRPGVRCTDLDDAHHHGVHHGCRCDEASLGGALGCRRQHRRRLDPHLPRRGPRRRRRRGTSRRSSADATHPPAIERAVRPVRVRMPHASGDGLLFRLLRRRGAGQPKRPEM